MGDIDMKPEILDTTGVAINKTPPKSWLRKNLMIIVSHGLTWLVSGISIWIAICANINTKEGNRIARESLEISTKATQIANDAFEAARSQFLQINRPTLVRVHVQSAVRDMLGAEAPGNPSWNISKCLQTVSEAGAGVVVLLARSENNDQILHSIDIALGRAEVERVSGENPNTYMTVGLGSQILRDLGVGKIRLMGAPIKYNAISGFDLEVTEYVSPLGA